MSTQTTDTTPSSGAPTDSANTTPATAPANPAADPKSSASTPEKKAHSRKPNHTGNTELGKFYRLRDDAKSIDDARVKEDLARATAAAHAVEAEARDIPGLKSDLARAESESTAREANLKARTALVALALKQQPQGQEIIDGAKDPVPALFAESLLKRIPDGFLGADQPLAAELAGSLKQAHLADEMLGRRQAKLDEAVARYLAGVRELKLWSSQLKASLRCYQARQKSAARQAA